MDEIEEYLQHPSYNPRDIVKYIKLAEKAIAEKNLPNNYLLFYEQTALAAYAASKGDLLKHCLDELNKHVSGSSRLNALETAIGKSHDDSKELLVWKTRIASMVGEERIKELVEFVKIYPNDAESYMELASCYRETGLLEQAIWCMHEVLLIIPMAYPVHADIASLLKDKDPAEALRWYLRSVELCTGYIPGLIGALELSIQLEKKTLANWAKAQLALVMENPGKRKITENEHATYIQSVH